MSSAATPSAEYRAFPRRGFLPTGIRFVMGGHVVAVAAFDTIELWGVDDAHLYRRVRLPRGGSRLHAWEGLPDGSRMLVSADVGGQYLMDVDGDVRCRIGRKTCTAR